MKKVYSVRLKKFNQEHDQRGQFTGPGTSHQPTGNPPGRPPSSGGKSPSLGRAVGAAGITAGAGLLGGYAGELGGALLGSAIGPEGTIAGSWTGEQIGQYAGQLLGSMVGDALGTKIGSALLGIKEKADQHGVGMGAFVGQEAAGWGGYAASRLLPGGSAVRGLFDLVPDVSRPGRLLASRAVQGGSEALGGAIGGTIAGASGGKGGEKAAVRAGEKAAKRSLRKHFLDKPPAAYKASGGKFMSMYQSSLPNLFGPKAWADVSSTPFGSYIRSRVKAIAEKMDDQAEANGIDTKPANPVDVSLARHSLQLKQQDAMQQQADQQRELAMAQAQGQNNPQKNGNSPLGKAFTLMRAPNDTAGLDLRRETGTPMSMKFLRRMQAKDTSNKQLALNRALAQPNVQNLQRAPNEDERTYRQRMQQVMHASIVATNRLRPQLFNGGAAEAGLSGLPPNQESRRFVVSKKRGSGKHKFTISANFAKGFNTEDTLAKGLVYGWASVIEKDGKIVTDHEGDRIDIEDLTDAAHNFITKSRNGGVLHDEYGHHIGHIVESVIFSKQLQKALGIDLGKVGWLIGYQITDPRVKMMVKGGLLKSFSVGGKGRRVPVEE